MKMLKYCALFFGLLVFMGCSDSPPDYHDMVLDGVASLNTEKPEKAIEDFTRAIDFDPAQADGYVGRGNAYNTLGRFEEAIADYNTALSIDPEIANAYVNRGIAYSHQGRIKEAIADYEKSLALDPEIDDPPGFVKRLFDNVPNREKGIKKHLAILKEHVAKSEAGKEK